MATLTFNRFTGSITLHDASGAVRGTWKAHNEVASTSGGEWPLGTYPWSHYNAHQEAGLMPACHAGPYGCFGIHVFAVQGRDGMGVHAGRTRGEAERVGGRTLGCIRVPVAAMEAINGLHATDKLTAIAVTTCVDFTPSPGVTMSA